MTEDVLLRLACLYAEQDRESFVAAYEHMSDDLAAVEAMAFLKALRAYRVKRWGKSKGEVLLDGCTATSPVEIAARKNQAFSVKGFTDKKQRKP